jgi:hypothetical protein
VNNLNCYGKHKDMKRLCVCVNPGADGIRAADFIMYD